MRAGYYGNLTEQIQIGAFYQSKISMDAYNKHKGLFAQPGGFDIPSRWSVGVPSDRPRPG